MFYYILMWGCDEGPDECLLFKANHYTDVARHIYNNQEKFQFVLKPLLRRKSASADSPEDILRSIRESYVDGDTYYGFRLIQYGDAIVVRGRDEL